MSEQTIFDACVEAVNNNGRGLDNGLAPDVARAVIQTIIDLTPSPRTVDELTYILLNGEVSREAIEAKADPASSNTLCGEATGSYQPGFYDRLQVLQMCGGNATMADLAWTWLNKSDAA